MTTIIKRLLALKAVTILCLMSATVNAIEINKDASIKDATNSIMGINHIGISVKNLDQMLEFYQTSTQFELVRREVVSQSNEADVLFGEENIEYEIAVLKAPNMLLELTQFKTNENAKITRMPVQGPGMTHTCFQSPSDNPGFDKFAKAGAQTLSRGGRPVDLGGYGVTYAYSYDPEGNMMELEQINGKALAQSGYDSTWQELDEDLWMSQVALATHDLERLVRFYQDVLGFKPYRSGELTKNKKADAIADVDNLHILGGWFRMNEQSKVIELWQYINPLVEKFEGKRGVTDLGYSFSLEVGDIQKEYKRLSTLGVEFISKPIKFGDFWQVFANDIDGNAFSLRQAVDPESRFSVKKMDVLAK